MHYYSYNAVRVFKFIIYSNFQISLDLKEAEILGFEKYVFKLAGVVECRYSPVTKIAVILYNPYAVSETELLVEIKKYPRIREISKEAVEPLEERETGEYVSKTDILLGRIKCSRIPQSPCIRC